MLAMFKAKIKAISSDVHTYSLSTFIISNYKDLNRSSDFLELIKQVAFTLISQCNRRLTASPKSVDSTNQRPIAADAVIA